MTTPSLSRASTGSGSTCVTCIAARHADPRTTMCYDRARMNLDRHPSYILAAYGLRNMTTEQHSHTILPI